MGIIEIADPIINTIIDIVALIGNLIIAGTFTIDFIREWKNV